MADVDIIIVGGGLVGAAAAVALAQQGYQTALVDRFAPDFITDELRWDSRIYALSPGNVEWLKKLGVWQHLNPERFSEISQMQVWGDDTVSPLTFDAYEAHVEHLGVIAENSQLQQALWQAMQENGVKIYTNVECLRLNCLPEQAVLHFADGTALQAALVIGADGGNSWVRTQANIATNDFQYQQQAVVANFSTELPHDNTARQWFGAEGVLAYLPLPERRMSMVWSTRQAQHLMTLSPHELAESVARAGQYCLGELKVITEPVCFTLMKQSAVNMVSARVALVGDAAHRIHPLAGQGVNLGFRDVIALVEVLAQRNPYQDIGDSSLLRRFERARKADVLSLGSLTHGLQWLFENELPSVKKIRNVGLGLTNRQEWLKRLLIQHAIV